MWNHKLYIFLFKKLRSACSITACLCLICKYLLLLKNHNILNKKIIFCIHIYVCMSSEPNRLLQAALKNLRIFLDENYINHVYLKLYVRDKNCIFSM